MELEFYIRKRLLKKKILVMTHLVMGYPSFKEGFWIIEAMVESGVDLIELQIPVSNPVLDGPIITRANQIALENGATVSLCLKFAEEVAHQFNIPFLIMSYSDPYFKYGRKRFVLALSKGNLKGAIIPDLPINQEKAYAEAMKANGLSPVLVFSPEYSEQKMRYLASLGNGFVYCKARKGVTGNSTLFGHGFEHYFTCCRRATQLPLAVGFGIGGRRDVDYLKGKADIAVIGTKIIKILDKGGISAVKSFIRGLL